jgi:sensor histidine kinase regulating citrate/malate metabolism
MVNIYNFAKELGLTIIILAFVVTALNLIYILLELEKIHGIIVDTKKDRESILLLDEEKQKSMDHIKEIKRLFQETDRDEMLDYIEKSQKEYYDEEIVSYDLEILNIVLQRYQYICNQNEIKFTYDVQNNVKALMEAASFQGEQLCTVLGNLMDNAIDILKEKETDRNLGLNILGNGYQVTIEVYNNGAKIPEKIMDKLFNYGFTTKSDGRGSGLFIVYKMIEKLGATLDVKSTDLKTSFSIIFDLE